MKTKEELIAEIVHCKEMIILYARKMHMYRNNEDATDKFNLIDWVDRLERVEHQCVSQGFNPF